MNIFDLKTTLREVIDLISRRKCLVCEEDLDKDLKINWKIPLCQKHRMKFLEEAAEENKKQFKDMSKRLPFDIEKLSKEFFKEDKE